MTATSLVRALDSTDAEERRQATARIVDLSAGEAIPLLLRSLGDADWRVRKQATLSARAFSGERPLLEALVERLGPSAEQGFGDVGLRNAIVDVLGAAGEPAVAVVGARLAELDADGRKLAVEVLGRSGDPSALAPLRTCVADVDDNVRHAAVESIALLGGVVRDEVIDVLQRCLEDEDRFVRLTALGGLQSLGAPLSWERLEPLALEPTTRAAALAAAGSTESPRAARALARALCSARGGSLAQALAAMTRMLDGQHRGDASRALRAEGPALAERLLGLAAAPAPASEPRSVPSLGFGEGAGDSMDQRAMALVLAAAAGAPGAAEAAIEALGEQAMAAAAPRALSLLGGVALPAVLARLRGGTRGGHTDPLAAEADGAPRCSTWRRPSRAPRGPTPATCARCSARCAAPPPTRSAAWPPARSSSSPTWAPPRTSPPAPSSPSPATRRSRTPPRALSRRWRPAMPPRRARWPTPPPQTTRAR
ncbi:MAG: HEAT repeat domain-containing protein [Polyangiaceae bacterium]